MRLPINTTKTYYSNFFSIKKKVTIGNGNVISETSDSKKSIALNLVKDKSIREVTETINILLEFNWINFNSFNKAMKDIIHEDEKTEDVIDLIISTTCPKLNYVVDYRKIPFSKEHIKINIEGIILNEISDKIEIRSYLIRSKSHNHSSDLKATKNYTILAENDPITYYIDEKIIIGNNYAPIYPGNTGDLLFKIELENEFDPPELIYNEKFREYFNSHKPLAVIESMLLSISFPYSEQILYWTVFGKPNYENKIHLNYIKYTSNLLSITTDSIKDVNEASIEEKLEFYTSNSKLLFEKVQTEMISWNKYLDKQIKSNLND